MEGLRHTSAMWSAALAILSMLVLVGMAAPALCWESGDVLLGPADKAEPTTYTMFYRIDTISMIDIFWNATGPLTFSLETPDGEMLWEDGMSGDWFELPVDRMGDIWLTWANFDTEESVTLTYQIDDWPMSDPVSTTISIEDSGGPGWIIIVPIVSAIIIVSLLFWFLSRRPRSGSYPAFMGAEMGSPVAGPTDLPYPNNGDIPIDTSPRTCWKCGAMVGPGMMYCPDCGAGLRGKRPPGDGS